MAGLAIRRLLIAGAGLALTVYLAYQLGNGRWLLSVMIVLASAYYICQRSLPVGQETLILSLLVFCYIVGNRGFAQITPLGNLPAFPGELSLFFCIGLMAMKIPSRKEFPFHFDWMALFIILWFLAATVRLKYDFEDYGILALRDYATVYYALFFYLAQHIARDVHSRRFFENVIIVALILLMLIYPFFHRYREFFFYNIRFDNAPIIFYKGDLAAVFFGMAFLLFYFHYLKNRIPLYWLLAFAGLFFLLYTTSRAAWVGMLFALIVLFSARIHQVLMNLAVVLIFSLIPVLFYLGFIAQNYQQTRIYSVYEHAVSVFDISGTGTYYSTNSRDTGANNRYRLVWWQTLVGETLSKSPLFGLGFGHNLTDRFVREFYNSFDERFSASRSPHSILFTIFSRMGILGSLLFLMIILSMISRTRVSIRLSIGRDTPPDSLVYWCMVWGIFGSACFGVVLEGPMGAIVFWTLLGMANALTYQDSSKKVPSPVPTPIATAPRLKPALS